MRIMIRLDALERDALLTLANREKRDMRSQAELIIRKELERCGLLPTSPGSIDPLAVQIHTQMEAVEC